MRQRKGYNQSVEIDVTAEDEPPVREWLADRHRTIQAMWARSAVDVAAIMTAVLGRIVKRSYFRHRSGMKRVIGVCSLVKGAIHMTIAPGGPRHHTGSIYMEMPKIVRELCEILTTKIVASLAGVKDPGQVRKWARGVLEPTHEAEQRLRFALDVIHEIEAARDRQVARAWALSINPRLDYGSPIKAIREGRYAAVDAAAKALMEDAYDG